MVNFRARDVTVVVLSGVCFALLPSVITWESDLRPFLNRQQVEWTCKSVHFGFKVMPSLPSFLLSRARHLKWLFLWLTSFSAVYHVIFVPVTPVTLPCGNAILIGWASCEIILTAGSKWLWWRPRILRRLEAKKCCASVLPFKDGVRTNYTCANPLNRSLLLIAIFPLIM